MNLLEGEGIEFFRLRHDYVDNALCIDQDKPTWEDLKEKSIQLALQLHTQHFHMPYPHRYTTPEKVLATEYTLREVKGARVNHDYASYLLYEIRKGQKEFGEDTESRAKRSRPLYMGVCTSHHTTSVLCLDRIQDLPPPIKVPETIQARQRPSKQKKDREQLIKEQKDLAKEKNEEKRRRAGSVTTSILLAVATRPPHLKRKSQLHLRKVSPRILILLMTHSKMIACKMSKALARRRRMMCSWHKLWRQVSS